jgi:aspartyl-tRNA(Asn)/glutamyl-tRNA(Gln) amidotransferase subunit C
MKKNKVLSVERVAELAALQLDPQENKRYQEQFDKILQHFAALQTVNVDGIEPLVTPHSMAVDLRKDEVHMETRRQDLLKTAPEIKDQQFKVPPVV